MNAKNNIFVIQHLLASFVSERYATLLDMAMDKTRIGDSTLQKKIVGWLGEFE